MLNKVILIGYVANDPELKYTPSGIAVSTFRVAVNRPFKNQQTGESEADFIDIVAWRQAAEFAANYLGKGRLVAVEGRLQIRNWTDREGGKRRAAEVVCENLKGLDRRRDPDTGGGPGATQPGGAEEVQPYDDPFQDE